MKDDLDKTTCQFNHATAKYVIRKLMLIGLSKQIIEYVESHEKELQSTITQQAGLIRRLKEDGERLADSNRNYANLLGGRDEDEQKVIELHTALMNELEKREALHD